MHMHMLKHAISVFHCFTLGFFFAAPTTLTLSSHLANGAQFFNERAGNVENVCVSVWVSMWVCVCVCVCSGVSVWVSLWFMNIGLASDRFCHFQLSLFVVESALLAGRKRKLFLMVTWRREVSSNSSSHFGYWYVSPSPQHLNCIYAHASINQTIYQNMSLDGAQMSVIMCEYSYYYRST